MLIVCNIRRDRMDMMKWWSARGTRGSSSSCPASHALTSKTKETLIKSTNAHSTSTITDLITDVETATIDSPPLAHTACQSCGKQASQVPPAAKLTTTTTTDTNAGEEKNHSLNVVNDEVKLRKCSRCRQVAYCSIECQKQDWKQGHRFTCKKQ